MQPFDRLRELFELAELGRLKAANSLWVDLSEDFRTRIMKLAVLCIQNPQNIDCEVHMTSSYGDFVVDQQFIYRLSQLLPRVVSANAP